MVSILKKKLVVFDLDGTLAESKAVMDGEMAELLVRLLKVRPVVVIGGGAYYKFKEQFIDTFRCPDELKEQLLLFPTTASSCYRFQAGEWREVYADEIPEADRALIRAAFEKAFIETGYTHPATVYGEIVEDRGTQVTFSALGQEAPVDAKKAWRGSSADTRAALKVVLDRELPNFEVRIPGYTSIDVTKKGVDKAYGIHQIEKQMNIAPADMVFVGDALYEGGNDYPVKAAGVDCIAVSGPDETKEVIRNWLQTLETVSI